MTLEWHDDGNGFSHAEGYGYYLGVRREGDRGFCALSELFGQQRREFGFRTVDEAKNAAAAALLEMLAARQELLNRIKEQLS